MHIEDKIQKWRESAPGPEKAALLADIRRDFVDAFGGFPINVTWTMGNAALDRFLGVPRAE